MHNWWQDLLIVLAGSVLGWLTRHFSIPPEQR